MENSTASLTLYTFQTRISSRPSSPFLNSSVLSSPPPADLVISPNVGYMAAELVITFLSTVGNLLVCAAVGLNRKLRTVTNYFLVSLAVADICVGAIAIPCAILTDIGLPRHNLYLCLLMLSVLIMFTQSSIFSLLAVAVERYLAIFMPFRYQVLMTPRNAVLVILTTWLLAFLIGLVPLMGWHKTPPDSAGEAHRVRAKRQRDGGTNESCGQDAARDEDRHDAFPRSFPLHDLLDPAAHNQLLPVAVPALPRAV